MNNNLNNFSLKNRKFDAFFLFYFEPLLCLSIENKNAQHTDNIYYFSVNLLNKN